MFTNYLKTTCRHFSKSKVNFVFKLGGLTVALLGFLIITIYVTYQLSFDQYHEDHASIYRVNSIRDEDGKLENYAMVPPAIGPSLKSEFPEIKAFTRIIGDRFLIKYNNNLMRIGGFIHADNSVFDVFSFKFIRGGKHSIDKPGTVVLTSSLAKQIFGSEDPIGRLISFPEKNNRTLEVTAIIEDLPVNTHMPIAAIIPFNAFENSESLDTNWQITWDGSVFLYLRLYPQTNLNSFAGKMSRLVKRKIAKHEDGSERQFGVFLQPIDEIYLSPGLKMEFLKKGNRFYVYVFSLLAFFLLVIACINYINLSIADFHHRSKEIGIRKILGARKAQILIQIALESLFYCSTGLFISLVILYAIFPQVSSFLDPNLNIAMLLKPEPILIVMVTILFIIILSTTYSAIKLSISNPVKDLKRETIFGGDLPFGKVLLLTQFIVSIICIAVTMVFSKQVDFLATKDLGFDRTNIITLFMPDDYPSEKSGVLKNELKALRGVSEVSYSYYLVTGVPYLRDWYKVEIENSMKQIQLNEIFVDHDFFKTMEIEILAGRDFDINNSADSKTAFIVNETAAREFGWNDPIGKRISYGFGETEGEKWEGTVVGLAKDFNTRSLHNKIEPLVIRLPFDEFPGMSLNIKIKGDFKEALGSIKSTYEKVLPGYIMDYKLVEDIYGNQYQSENKALKALQFGTWIVLLISAFGIFSLSLFLSVRRMKEFGIRKVLGAKVRQIAFLHISYFLRIAMIAVVISLPISYWLTEQWLNGFAYHVEPGVVIFLGVIVILFLLIIVSAAYSSVRASRMNPVDAIKLE